MRRFIFYRSFLFIVQIPIPNVYIETTFRLDTGFDVSFFRYRDRDSLAHRQPGVPPAVLRR